jgi:AmmeMemoRadiSam system protein B
MVRKPAVAGQFYGGTQAQCAAEIEDCLPQGPIGQELPDPIVAGIVPHAGWIFSGRLAASVFAAVKQVNGPVDTFVIFGAAHRYFDGKAVVYPEGAWRTPLGEIAIDTEVAQWLVEAGGELDPRAHAGEHSIEVQVPFIQFLFPQAKIVPVIVPVMGFDQSFGARAGERVRADVGKKVVFIGSTDLTHYGPRYGFCPEGAGPDAIRWAREVNDVEFITMALEMDDSKLVQSAMEKGNACGPAAVAATIAAARAMGAIRGVLLGHTTSSDIMEEKFGRSSEESVGYAAIVY